MRVSRSEKRSPIMNGTSDPASEPACDAPRATVDDGIEFTIIPRSGWGDESDCLDETPSHQAPCRMSQFLRFRVLLNGWTTLVPIPFITSQFVSEFVAGNDEGSSLGG